MMTSPKLRPWHWLALAAITLLAVGLNCYAIDHLGYANQYYAAAVKSMLANWRAGFFASFDAAGFVTVDKPPVGLWLQGLSAAIFGFHGWALILPQALAGALAVPLLFQLVRRHFGPGAGLLAALILALSPISVAANRNNTMDSTLVLTSLLAAWAASLAAEKGKLRWLLLCALLIGLGFNIKMLQAYMVLPACFLLYLLAPAPAWWRRLLHLALAGLLLLTVSLSWAVVVDLIPPDQRPYIGSSQTNSVLELIIGHNGLTRLLPGGLRAIVNPGGRPVNPPGNLPPGDQPVNPAPPGIHPPAGTPAPPGAQGQPTNPGPTGQTGAAPANQGPAGSETGETGLLRLFNRQLAGQSAWFILPALLGGLFILLAPRPAGSQRFTLDAPRQSAVLWLGWIIPQMVFFSFASLFHRYYLDMLAPGLAALTAAGLFVLWSHYRAPGWRGWLLPPTLGLSAIVQALIIAPFSGYRWLIPLVLGLTLLSALALLLIRLLRPPATTPNGDQSSAPRAALSLHPPLSTLPYALTLAALLLAPFVWSLTPLIYGGDSGLPFAGPDLARGRQPGVNLAPGPRPAQAVASPLAAYLLAHHTGETFLAATQRANDAAPLILATGRPVMATGGFSGSDPILTPADFAARVAAGEVRYFLLPNSGQGQPGAPGRPGPQGPSPQGLPSDIPAWVRQNCAPVIDPALPLPAGQLYDCRAR
jgi:4-amino-4-deoxy-L-arabinose transferase-like glycosyltransferase